MRIVGIIPARLESARLPGKALKDINGLPAIVHTYKRSCLAHTLDAVYVATDSKEICESLRQYGGQVLITGPHRNGSERIAEAINGINCDLVVNVQGDEVLVDPQHIDAIVTEMISDSTVQYCAGVTSFHKTNSPSDFKAVVDLSGNLLYCSRADIPYFSKEAMPALRLKMVFIMGFRRPSLERFVTWPATPLEAAEPNEFLRILEHGEKIKTVYLKDAKISLDTKSDLVEIRAMMKHDKLKSLYTLNSQITP